MCASPCANCLRWRYDKGTRYRRRVHSKWTNIQKVSIKGFVKFQKQFCTLRHATGNDDGDLAFANVPFEETDLSLIARSWMRGSTRDLNEAFREQEDLSRDWNVVRFAFVKQITPRNYILLFVEPLLKFLQLNFDREKCDHDDFARFTCDNYVTRRVHW